MSSPKPLIINLMGPTAAGKTDVAVKLVETLPCDIISVDSALVYRGMDIGTAKPDAATLARAPHRLIDSCDPAESYSAAQFCEDALREIQAIHLQGRIPLLVGGTMLYYRALLQGLSPLPKADPSIRAAIAKEAETHGWAFLHKALKRVDLLSAQRIHENDPQRISRALEVYRATGKSLSQFYENTPQHIFPYDTLSIAIAPKDRQVLHQRIERRLTIMFQQGFEEEVRALFARGDLHVDLPSMRSVGYRQVWAHLEGQYGHAEMKQRALFATRQLAKRQLTWLRQWKHPLIWVDSLQADLLKKVSEAVAVAMVKHKP